MTKKKTEYLINGKPVFQPLVDFMLNIPEIEPEDIQLACRLYGNSTKKYYGPINEMMSIRLSEEDAALIVGRYAGNIDFFEYRYLFYSGGTVICPGNRVSCRSLSEVEKEWVWKNQELFLQEVLSASEVMKIFDALLTRRFLNSWTYVEPFIYVLWFLEVFDLSRTDPCCILWRCDLDKDEFKVHRGIEPHSVSYLKTHLLPQTEQARKECLNGLEQRIIPWDEALELFPVEEGTKLDFPSVKSMIRKLDPSAAPKVKKSYTYKVRLYSRKDGEFVAQLSSVKQFYAKTNLDPEDAPLTVGVPLFINDLIAVKERTEDKPDGKKYLDFYKYY